MSYLEVNSILEALEYQMKALEIQREINDDRDEIADTLYNLGATFFNPFKPKTDLALDYFFQALQIYQ
ncbi:unnamed protein product [Rotaria sp. Silwood2]|nr:unnamed protein product [Rotaria sp. Silwood2]CAF4498177.1 unnamed protein product [Rotaria sp. Silwood2]